MECLPMSLTQCLEQYKMIPNHIKNSILLDVSLGLLYLHKQTPPIVHGDLTANNVLLTYAMKAKIADLGVSYMFEPDSTKHYMRMSTYPGTWVYMPPEAQKVNFKETSTNFDKLDVFSFGVLILHVYTQEWPEPTDAFDEHNMPRTEVQRRKHLLDKIESSISLKQLAERCLYNQPQSRPGIDDVMTGMEVVGRTCENHQQNSLLQLSLDIQDSMTKEKDLLKKLEASNKEKNDLTSEVLLLKAQLQKHDSDGLNIGEEKYRDTVLHRRPGYGILKDQEKGDSGKGHSM